jgi:hypothetical protein
MLAVNEFLNSLLENGEFDVLELLDQHIDTTIKLTEHRHALEAANTAFDAAETLVHEDWPEYYGVKPVAADEDSSQLDGFSFTPSPAKKPSSAAAASSADVSAAAAAAADAAAADAAAAASAD